MLLQHSRKIFFCFPIRYVFSLGFCLALLSFLLHWFGSFEALGLGSIFLHVSLAFLGNWIFLIFSYIFLKQEYGKSRGQGLHDATLHWEGAVFYFSSLCGSKKAGSSFSPHTFFFFGMALLPTMANESIRLSLSQRLPLFKVEPFFS